MYTLHHLEDKNTDAVTKIEQQWELIILCGLRAMKIIFGLSTIERLLIGHTLANYIYVYYLIPISYLSTAVLNTCISY